MLEPWRIVTHAAARDRAANVEKTVREFPWIKSLRGSSGFDDACCTLLRRHGIRISNTYYMYGGRRILAGEIAHWCAFLAFLEVVRLGGGVGVWIEDDYVLTPSDITLVRHATMTPQAPGKCLRRLSPGNGDGVLVVWYSHALILPLLEKGITGPTDVTYRSLDMYDLGYERRLVESKKIRCMNVASTITPSRLLQPTFVNASIEAGAVESRPQVHILRLEDAAPEMVALVAKAVINEWPAEYATGGVFSAEQYAEQLRGQQLPKPAAEGAGLGDVFEDWGTGRSVFVAVEKGSGGLAGCVSIGVSNDDPFGDGMSGFEGHTWLQDLLVVPEYRQCGVAKRLVAAALAAAESTSVHFWVRPCHRRVAINAGARIVKEAPQRALLGDNSGEVACVFEISTYRPRKLGVAVLAHRARYEAAKAARAAAAAAKLGRHSNVDTASESPQL